MSSRPATSAKTEGYRDIRSTTTFILAGLSGGHGVFHWFTQSFLVMLPEVKATFSLNPVQVGAITATREVVAGIVALPGGVLADMLRRHWGLVLAVCMAGFGLGWLLVGLSPVYPLLLVGMAVVSMVSSMWHLPASAALSQHFPQRRGSALSIHGIGGSVGDVLGPLLTGVLLAVLSWQGILTVYAVAPLFLAFLVFWAFRDIGRTGDSAPAPDFRAQIKRTRLLFKNSTLWIVTLVAGFRGMAFVAFLTFLPLYMDDVLHLSPQSRGFHFALLILLGVVSTPALGYLSDRVGRKPVLIPSMLALCALSALLALYGEGAMLTLLIALMGLFLYGDQPILTAAALDIVGENVATTTLGVLSFARLVLSSTAPPLVGLLYQTWGIEAAFYCISALFALAAAILLWVPLRIYVESNAPGGHVLS